MDDDPLMHHASMAMLALVFLGAFAGTSSQATAEEVPKTPTQTATAFPMPTSTPSPTASPTPTITQTPTPTAIEIIPLWTLVTCNESHLVTYDTWMTGHPIYSEGAATFYAPYLMEGTASYRGLDLTGYVDGVSLMSPSDIGKEVWIKHEGIWEGPFLSVDTAQQNHMCQAIQTRGEVVEVGYKTAHRWGMTDWPKVHEWKVHVEVSLVPPEQLDIDIVNFPEWWSERAELLP